MTMRSPFICPVCDKNLFVNKLIIKDNKLEIITLCHNISFSFDIILQGIFKSFNDDDDFHNKIGELIKAFYLSEYGQKDNVYLVFFDKELMTDNFTDLLNRKFGKETSPDCLKLNNLDKSNITV